MGCKIYIFRHGQTAFNRDSKFTGWSESRLTKTGFEDAKIIALRLKDKKFQIAFHTSLSRSKDTLKEVLKFHPECVKLIEDDRLRERNYGSLNGKTHLQAVEKYGAEHYDKWHRGFYDKPPKGESFAIVELRVKNFIQDLIKLIKKEKVNVAISAHGNSIRLFRKIMENASVKETTEWFIPYDKVFEYDVLV
jgi:broad specificity phosphatase PhoE